MKRDFSPFETSGVLCASDVKAGRRAQRKEAREARFAALKAKVGTDEAIAKAVVSVSSRKVANLREVRSGQLETVFEENVKSVVEGEGRRVTLTRKLAEKSFGSKLLREERPALSKRLGLCSYAQHSGYTTMVKHTETGRCRLKGLQTCQSVWACPICSPRISEKRRQELVTGMMVSKTLGLSVWMLTLTARHDRTTVLQTQLEGMKAALKAFGQSPGWRALDTVGSVTATEVTIGGMGWHTHFHRLIFLKAGVEDGAERLEALRGQWLKCLKNEGFDAEGVVEAAFHVQGATAAGTYVAKFGAAEELTLSTVKEGRKGSRTPWQLLTDAEQGDAFAAKLWVEFAMAFEGRRQLVWSVDLKGILGIEEVSDAEAAAEEADAEAKPNAEVVVRVWDYETWKKVRPRMASILKAAEVGASIDAAEQGMTDAELWRLARAEAQQTPPPGS